MSSFDYEKMNKSMVDRLLKSTFSDYDPVRDGDEERKLLLNIIAEDFSADSVGKYGEHLTKKALIEGIDGYKQFVSNLIIPIGNSETEIDLVMIHEKGLLVVESKTMAA